MSTEPKCPFDHTAGSGTSNQDWWPKRLKLNILRQHSSLSDPMGEDSTTPRSSRASTFRP